MMLIINDSDADTSTNAKTQTSFVIELCLRYFTVEQ